MCTLKYTDGSIGRDQGTRMVVGLADGRVDGHDSRYFTSRVVARRALPPKPSSAKPSDEDEHGLPPGRRAFPQPQCWDGFQHRHKSAWLIHLWLSSAEGRGTSCDAL